MHHRRVSGCDQDQNEWVLLTRGAARLRFEYEVVNLKSGDFINVPAHKKHRIEWTTRERKAVWLAVFFD